MKSNYEEMKAFMNGAYLSLKHLENYDKKKDVVDRATFKSGLVLALEKCLELAKNL